MVCAVHAVDARFDGTLSGRLVRCGVNRMRLNGQLRSHPFSSRPWSSFWISYSLNPFCESVESFLRLWHEDTMSGILPTDMALFV